MLYKSKYRIESTRLKNWDYSSSGYYYITVCTQNREHYFGEVITTKDYETHMVLSEIGNVVDQCWCEIPRHFPFVRLDEYVIMPNHLHGIVEIIDATVKTQNFASLHIASLPNEKFGPQSKNVSSIIRGFKIGVTKWATMNASPFAWQPRFYDHIIRDQEDLNRIRNYIKTNPDNWDKDEENTKI